MARTIRSGSRALALSAEVVLRHAATFGCFGRQEVRFVFDWLVSYAKPQAAWAGLGGCSIRAYNVSVQHFLLDAKPLDGKALHRQK